MQETRGLIPGLGRFPWRREWQPTLVFLPGEFHGQRSLVSYSPCGRKRVGHDRVTKQQQQTYSCYLLLALDSITFKFWPFFFFVQRFETTMGLNIHSSVFGHCNIFTRGLNLVVLWLRLQTSNAGGMGLITGWGTKIPHVCTTVKNKNKKPLSFTY